MWWGKTPILFARENWPEMSLVYATSFSRERLSVIVSDIIKILGKKEARRAALMEGDGQAFVVHIK
jgi:hypothetical protein